MSRKDFVVLAISLRGSFATVKNKEQQDGVRQAILDLADSLELNYPNFDRARFIEAAIPAFIRKEAA